MHLFFFKKEKKKTNTEEWFQSYRDHGTTDGDAAGVLLSLSLTRPRFSSMICSLDSVSVFASQGKIRSICDHN